MEQKELLAAILESLDEEVVFVDTQHIIRYINQFGRKKYAKYGDLLGKSIFDCHNPQSGEIIKNCYIKLQNGEAEVLFSENAKRCIYMRAVRGTNGQILGYYERFISKELR